MQNKNHMSPLSFIIVVVGLPIALIVAFMSYSNWQAHIGPGSILGIPSVSAEQIDNVLCKAKSPACGTGQDLYDQGYRHNIDPSFALAVFHEGSDYSKLACNPSPACITFKNTWKNSYKLWYDQLETNYTSIGITTSSAIIAKMSPPNSSLYAQTVNTDMTTWESQKAQLS